MSFAVVFLIYIVITVSGVVSFSFPLLGVGFCVSVLGVFLL